MFLFDQLCTLLPTTPSPGDQFNCGDGTRIPIDKVCDFISDCSNGNDEAQCADCNFEESTCKYGKSEIGSSKWERTKASNVTIGTGPPFDSTLGIFSNKLSIPYNTLFKLNDYRYSYGPLYAGRSAKWHFFISIF